MWYFQILKGNGNDKNAYITLPATREQSHAQARTTVHSGPARSTSFRNRAEIVSARECRLGFNPSRSPSSHSLMQTVFAEMPAFFASAFICFRLSLNSEHTNRRCQRDSLVRYLQQSHRTLCPALMMCCRLSVSLRFVRSKRSLARTAATRLLSANR